MLKRPRAILFDFGQTLVDSANGFRLAEKEAQKRLFAALGPEDWATFIDAYRSIRAAHHRHSSLSRVTIWTAVFKHFNRPSDTQLLTEWETVYWQTVKERTRAFPETRETLEILSASYRLGVVSNTQGQTSTGVCHRLGEMPEFEVFFDAVVIAGEDGTPPKPDPRPFLKCLEMLSVKPGEAVYVGDDYEKDVLGALATGLHPVWLKHRDVRRTWPSIRKPAAPVIHTLEPLVDLERLMGKWQ